MIFDRLKGRLPYPAQIKSVLMGTGLRKKDKDASWHAHEYLAIIY